MTSNNRAVDVLHTDGRWYPGTLERWRHDADRGWRGYVWWNEGVGLQHVEWIPADRLRARKKAPDLSTGEGVLRSGGS